MGEETIETGLEKLPVVDRIPILKFLPDHKIENKRMQRITALTYRSKKKTFLAWKGVYIKTVENYFFGIILCSKNGKVVYNKIEEYFNHRISIKFKLCSLYN